MIDFNRNTFFKLKQTDTDKGARLVAELLTDGETVCAAFRDVRGWVVFTDRRVIAVNVENVTGKKKNYTSLPYAKITVFAVETAGVMDVDSRLDLWFSGLGRVRFEFTGQSDVVGISRRLARCAMRA